MTDNSRHLFAENGSRYSLRCVLCGVGSLDREAAAKPCPGTETANDYPKPHQARGERHEDPDPYYCADCGHHAIVHNSGETETGCDACECDAFDRPKVSP